MFGCSLEQMNVRRQPTLTAGLLESFADSRSPVRAHLDQRELSHFRVPSGLQVRMVRG